MKRACLLPILALCLLLSGCGWLDGSYVSIKPHQEQRQDSRSEVLTATSYRDLVRILCDLVAEGAQTGLINIAGYPQETVKGGMDTAVQHVMERDPIGAYAVSDIQYELGAKGSLSALAVEISYRHSAAQIRAIQQVPDLESARQAVASALERYDSEVVLLMKNVVVDDFSQFVRSHAEEHPDLVMEIPQVTTSVYGESLETVVEITFAYQNSRDDLRKMQTQVKPVFDSAVLYVSGDGEEHQKFTQLYAFLMERFPYQIETSITPAYSLLRHGVGDSRAFALIYAAMCREAGLTCLTVTGTCAGEPRTWNIVFDDGRYYHLDLLRCYESGGFRERTDDKMAGYVWDYSAYPACPAASVPASQVSEEIPSDEAGSPVEETTSPTESTISETLPAEQTVPPTTSETVAGSGME